MALVETWRSKVAADPGLLVAAVELGLKKLGYQCIKAEQLSAVQAVLKGNHVFVSVPTGFGKSHIYQLLPFCAESLLQSTSAPPVVPVVVVVSPLLSLMYDQVTKLSSKHIKAVCISAAASKSDDMISTIDMVSIIVGQLLCHSLPRACNVLWVAYRVHTQRTQLSRSPLRSVNTSRPRVYTNGH